MVYCLALLTLTTKWVVQAPLNFVISQIGLYIANSIGTNASKSAVFGCLILNTFLPLVIFFISFFVFKTKVSLYISKMSEAISVLEIQKILKMIPQALFFIDESKDEVLHQSDAMKAFFGQPIEKILPVNIFEVKDSTAQQDKQDEIKEEVNYGFVDQNEPATEHDNKLIREDLETNENGLLPTERDLIPKLDHDKNAI